MYTDKPYDAATGLYYSMARFYDPTTGRFVTQDPYNGTKQQPLSQNRYVYALDNPMRYVDPSGQMLVDDIDGGSGVGSSSSSGQCISSSSELSVCLKFFGDFVTLLLDLIVFAIPAAVFWEWSMDSAAWNVLSSPAFNLVNLGSDFLTGNVNNLLTDTENLALNVLSAWWISLSWWEQLAFGLTTAIDEAGNVISAGTAQLVTWGIYGLKIGWDMTTLVSDYFQTF